jgi:hypothetical protein
MPKIKPAPRPEPTLQDLAQEAELLCEDANALIDRMAEDQHEQMPGTPAVVYRTILTKGNPCACATIRRLAKETQP